MNLRNVNPNWVGVVIGMLTLLTMWVFRYQDSHAATVHSNTDWHLWLYVMLTLVVCASLVVSSRFNLKASRLQSSVTPAQSLVPPHPPAATPQRPLVITITEGFFGPVPNAPTSLAVLLEILVTGTESKRIPEWRLKLLQGRWRYHLERQRPG